MCRDTGSYWTASSHNTVAGEGERVGTCRGLVDDFSDELTFTVRDGVVRDTFTEFIIAGGCGTWDGTTIDARYSGTITRGPPLKMGGESACSVNFSGSWEATPAVPAASIRLQPDTASIVVHETLYLNPIVRPATGVRLFDRELSWSSGDTAVARVSEDGSVFGAGVGVTTIEVNTMGIAADAAIATSSISLASVLTGTYHTCGLT